MFNCILTLSRFFPHINRFYTQQHNFVSHLKDPAYIILIAPTINSLHLMKEMQPLTVIIRIVFKYVYNAPILKDGRFLIR